MAVISGGISVIQASTNADIYDIWPKVRDGINTIEKRCKGVFYRPEDCYHEIKTGLSRLLIATDKVSGEYEGFALLQNMPYPDGNGIHIKAMHHQGNCPSFVDDFFDIIEIIARSENIKRISYSSSRKGWSKRMKNKNYQCVASIHYYEKVTS